MYNDIIGTIKLMELSHDLYTQDLILNYDDAERIGGQFNWQGSESKNLVLKDSLGNYYVNVTFVGEHFDRKQVKTIIGEKLSSEVVKKPYRQQDARLVVYRH